MKTSGKVAVLLVVLALCLPSYGEILIYKLTEKDTFFDQLNSEWDIDTEKTTAYLVLDVNYVDGTITQAELVAYGRDEIGKFFEQIPVDDLELVRAISGSDVSWVIVQKSAELTGDDITAADFTLLDGRAKDRDIGSGVDREVANKLRGNSLFDFDAEGSRSLGRADITISLFSNWTKWANGTDADEGNQDFDRAVDFVAQELTRKGFEDITDIDGL